MAAGPVDLPDAERKAHTTPTPTSGGLGIALGFAIGLALVALFSTVLRNAVTPQGVRLATFTAVFAFAFLLVGFWDDARPIDAKLKFALFAALSLGAVFTVGIVREFPVGSSVLMIP